MLLIALVVFFSTGYLPLTSATTCQNDGILLPDNSTCLCGPYTSGKNCEEVLCQNWGANPFVAQGGVQRCFCPPGYAAKYCETRGCRPAVEDNQIPEERSFVVVLPAVPSMKTARDQIADQITTAVNELQKNEPGFINSYVLLVAYSTEKEGASTGVYTFGTDLNAFVTNLRNIDMNLEGTTLEQPLMLAIDTGLRTSSEILPQSIFFIFTDRLDMDGVVETYTPSQNTQQLSLAQRALAWQVKLFFFILPNPQINIDYTSPKYNVYRQLATYTQGNVFVLQDSEVKTILTNVAPFFYKPQNTDSRSFAVCNSMKLNLPEERLDGPVKVVVTVDKNIETPANFAITLNDFNQQIVIAPKVSGKYYALYEIESKWNISGISLSISPSAVCSVRIFVSNVYPVLLSYTDNPLVDVGSIPNFAEAQNSIMASFMGFTPKTPSIFIADSTTGNLYFNPLDGISRNSNGKCTADYTFQMNQKCSAGPFSHYLTFTFLNRLITRVVPGLCLHHADVALSPEPAAQKPASLNGTFSCDSMNYQDLDEPRLHQFKQIVFVLELTQQMKASLNNFMPMFTDFTNGLRAKDNSPRQYTLITFDDKGWTARISNQNAMSFSSKVTSLLPDLIRNAPTLNSAYQEVYSPEAVYGAVQLKLNRGEIIHVFTTSPPTIQFNNHVQYYMPTDVQVNYFYIIEDNNAPLFFPMDMQKYQTISGGRLIPMTPASINTMSDALVDATFDNNFIFDGSLESCENGQFQFVVETGVTSISISIVGLGAPAHSTVLDNDQRVIPILDVDIRLSAPNSVIWKIIPTAKKAKSGIWTLNVKTTSGACYVQVRAQSSVNVAIGYTSSQTDDNVSKYPFTRRSYPGAVPFFVAARSVSEPVKLLNVVMEAFPIEYPWNNTIYKNMTTQAQFQMRDLSTCAYQFISAGIMLPLQWALRVTIIGKEANPGGLGFQRRFFYYNDVDDYCKNLNYAPDGECKCDTGYTGQFCYDPICQNGGMSNHGACSCLDGFRGTFCETCYNPPCKVNVDSTTVNPESTTKYSSSICVYVVLFMTLFVIV